MSNYVSRKKKVLWYFIMVVRWEWLDVSNVYLDQLIEMILGTFVKYKQSYLWIALSKSFDTSVDLKDFIASQQ